MMSEAEPHPAKPKEGRQKLDPAAKAERKRRAREKRQRREQAEEAPPVQADAAAAPVASRLHRIEQTLAKQTELTDELLRKVKSLVSIDLESRKGAD